MASELTPQQIDFFRTNGYLFPFRAISPAEAAALRGRIEAYEAEAGEEVNKRLKIKAHLAFPWMCELARHPAIVEAVQSLLVTTAISTSIENKAGPMMPFCKPMLMMISSISPREFIRAPMPRAVRLSSPAMRAAR